MVIVAVPVLIVALPAGQPPLPRRRAAAARRVPARSKSVVSATNRVVVYVESLDAATERAAWYAQEIAGRDYTAVYVPGNGRPDPRGGWWDLGRVPVETLPESDKPAEPLLDYVWGLPRSESEFVTVVVPELFDEPSLKDAVAAEKVDVRAQAPAAERARGRCHRRSSDLQERMPAPERLAVRVLVSGVQAASLRAVNYARSLGVRRHACLLRRVRGGRSRPYGERLEPRRPRPSRWTSRRRRIATSATHSSTTSEL